MDPGAEPRSAGQPIAGEKLPRPTELAERFDERFGRGREWEGIYDYLCATANHPTLSAFEFFGYSVEVGVTINISDDLLERLLAATLVAFVKALQSYAGYCEWDTTTLDELIDWTNGLIPGTCI